MNNKLLLISIVLTLILYGIGFWNTYYSFPGGGYDACITPGTWFCPGSKSKWELLPEEIGQNIISFFLMALIAVPIVYSVGYSIHFLTKRKYILFLVCVGVTLLVIWGLNLFFGVDLASLVRVYPKSPF